MRITDMVSVEVPLETGVGDCESAHGIALGRIVSSLQGVGTRSVIDGDFCLVLELPLTNVGDPLSVSVE